MAAVGIVGAGVMGNAFGDLLRSHGHQVETFTRTATGAPPHQLGRFAAVLVCVATGAQLQRVVEDLVAETEKTPLLVWTGTAAHSDVMHAQALAAEAGVGFVDAPVSGTPEMVRQGQAVMFAGGEAASVDELRRLLSPQRVERVGAVGDGTRLKYVANALLAMHTAAAAEAVVMAEEWGLPFPLVADALRGSAASSAAFDHRANRMADRVFEPAKGPIKGLVSDLAVITAELPPGRAPRRFLEAAVAVFDAAVANGHGDQDLSAIVEPLRATRHDSGHLGGPEEADQAVPSAPPGEPPVLSADILHTLFVLRHRFQRPAEEFADAYPAHRAFVSGHLAAGRMLSGGPTVPWDGGLIVLRVGTRAEAEQIVASDPLVAAGITKYDITEWRTTTRLPAFTALLDQLNAEWAMPDTAG